MSDNVINAGLSLAVIRWLARDLHAAYVGNGEYVLPDDSRINIAVVRAVTAGSIMFTFEGVLRDRKQIGPGWTDEQVGQFLSEHGIGEYEEMVVGW